MGAAGLRRQCPRRRRDRRHRQVAKAEPNGYTALFATGAFTLNPSLHSKLPYDTLKDFTPVTLVASGPHALTVHPSVPAKDVNELVALVRANPGKYSFASSGANTQPRLVGELFKLKFGLDLVHVPFNGGGPAMTSTIGGHTPIAFTSLGNAAPSIKDGKLRALALTSARRLAEFPDVPTMAEAGLPELVTGSMQGVVLPARTPKPIVDRWHADVAKIVALPEIRDRADRVWPRAGCQHSAGVRGLDQGGDREVGRGDAGGQDRQDLTAGALRPHPEEPAEGGRLEGWPACPDLQPILRDAVASRPLLRMRSSEWSGRSR